MFLRFFHAKWRELLNLVYMGLVVGGVLWLFLKMAHVLAPFLIGVIIFLCIEPFAMWLQRKKWSKVWATGVSMIVFILVLGAVIGVGSAIGVGKMIEFAKQIPLYSDDVGRWLDHAVKVAKGKMEMIPVNTWEEGKKQIEGMVKIVGQGISTFLVGGLSAIGAFSKFMFNTVLGTIFAFLLSVERDRIVSWYYVSVPLPFKRTCSFLGKHVVAGMVGYVEAQVKLVSVTFVVIWVALMLIGVKHAFSVSLAAAFMDILPLLGVSTVFVPWIAYLLIIKDVHSAVWIAGLWMGVIVVRHILEPKVTGKSIGVSAFEMFATMVLCIGLFGVWGAFLSPIVLLIGKALLKEGYLLYWMQIEPQKSNIEKKKM